MTSYILIGEGLLIIGIIVWMVRKMKAIGRTDDDAEIPQQGADKPDLELPDDEKWE